jgi:hypothetical protein
LTEGKALVNKEKYSHTALKARLMKLVIEPIICGKCSCLNYFAKKVFGSGYFLRQVSGPR